MAKDDTANQKDGSRHTRRSFLKKGAGLAVSLSALSALPVIGCGQQAAPSASPAASKAATSAAPSASASSAASAASTPDAKAKLAQLYEAAKKEGEILWYTTHSIPDAEALNNDFNQRYPGVKAQFWRNTSEQIRDKIITESQAGRFAADVSYVGTEGYTDMKPLLKPYKVLTYDDYGKDYKDPDGLWLSNYLTCMTPCYNTNLVKASEAPKTWEDLLDARWKGKLSLEGSDANWMAGMIKVWGKDKAMDYMTKMAAQSPQMRTSHITQLDLLAAGEYAIVVAGYNYYAEQLKGKGAPVEWVRINPVITNSVNFGLLAKAPHPNAAMLMMEYLGSVEAQQLMSKQGRFTSLFSKAPPKASALLEVSNNIVLIPPSMSKEVDEASQEFQKLFMPKAG